MNSFSFSALSTAYRCNKLYQYQFIDQLTPPGPDSGDMSFGTGMHLGLEYILQGKDGVGIFEHYWNSEKTKNNRYGRYGWDELMDQGKVLLARFQRLHAKKFEMVEMEQRLYGTIDGVQIEGSPDYLGSYNGKASVVDFKTSGYRYPKDKILTSTQLHLYAHLARQQRAYQAVQLVYVVFIKGKDPSIQILCRDINEQLLQDHVLDVKLQALELIEKNNKKVFTRNRANCYIGEVKCPFFEKCNGGEST